ncbi:M56 family metallopeptidase [Intrasporangium calvum]|uniref:Peptidase M48 Ste24p n=1 Tax=Intrasporangium calvum (strain ATCC 23552 / DSM 43043 / JCM 3097 / NBRC 12989 / NCIMB 10167 / NRRL B-3866 / 7 KIP) TaxID=710696 RepID=E6S633_INTC7|nr:M56 family metallopeptidase [Intrasporangium calvum]ADU46773.1 peptidase M48 Ste24p [Intrasporangium calvum DSM 43043]AXG15136.1 M56 family peptidase [Intrasporangium calvum]
MVIAALLTLTIALAWPVPRLMAGMTTFRRAPRAALVVWQSTTMGAVLAALFAAPAALPYVIGPTAALADNATQIAVAVAVSGLIAGRLIVSGHRVGTRLRAHRRRHRRLVDLLAVPVGADGSHAAHMRVIEHPTPTAYCVPGMRRRVVLTQGTLDSLPEDQLVAVLAHERAHLRARHDLILEFFTVIHEAVPSWFRCEMAMHEVKLLIEVLADRAAVRATGVVSTARAIVGMATGAVKPEGMLAMGESPSAARLRLELLQPGPVAGLPAGVAATVMYLFATSVVIMPVALLVVAWATA